MPQQVVAGAILACTFGEMPGELNVLPLERVNALTPAATIMDFIPVENITTFGLCASPANPEVIIATAAAMGVPTPMPCVPTTIAPWLPGSPNVLIGGLPALNNESLCECMWGGVISVAFPGQPFTQIP